jgi:hypothetical protein
MNIYGSFLLSLGFGFGNLWMGTIGKDLVSIKWAGNGMIGEEGWNLRFLPGMGI